MANFSGNSIYEQVESISLNELNILDFSDISDSDVELKSHCRAAHDEYNSTASDILDHATCSTPIKMKERLSVSLVDVSDLESNGHFSPVGNNGVAGSTDTIHSSVQSKSKDSGYCNRSSGSELSLASSAGCTPSRYDKVESKVKKYIEDIKKSTGEIGIQVTKTDDKDDCSQEEVRLKKLKEELEFKDVMISALQESNTNLRLKCADAENKISELRLKCEQHCTCCSMKVQKPEAEESWLDTFGVDTDQGCEDNNTIANFMTSVSKMRVGEVTVRQALMSPPKPPELRKSASTLTATTGSSSTTQTSKVTAIPSACRVKPSPGGLSHQPRPNVFPTGHDNAYMKVKSWQETWCSPVERNDGIEVTIDNRGNAGLESPSVVRAVLKGQQTGGTGDEAPGWTSDASKTIQSSGGVLNTAFLAKSTHGGDTECSFGGGLHFRVFDSHRLGPMEADSKRETPTRCKGLEESGGPANIGGFNWSTPDYTLSNMRDTRIGQSISALERRINGCDDQNNGNLQSDHFSQIGRLPNYLGNQTDCRMPSCHGNWHCDLFSPRSAEMEEVVQRGYLKDRNANFTNQTNQRQQIIKSGSRGNLYDCLSQADRMAAELSAGLAKIPVNLENIRSLGENRCPPLKRNLPSY